MNERDFYYWLQGFFELSDTNTLSEKQVQIIKEHMALVATKQTPTSMFDEKPVKVDSNVVLDNPTCLTC